SSNIQEYWAQCASAYFSRPYTDQYASSYNPEWLRTNDPGMYDLLEDVFGPPRGGAAQQTDILEMQYRARATA
ncbi:MAG: hypothetical protein ACREBC_39300, partial [Pyrinomonadaceae bacterium]